jgi:serine phosphatase RsbU (regulator of sigma subunit)
VSIIKHSGPLLGYFKKPSFEERRFTLGKGDRLYLYTDGLIEVLNEDKKLLSYNGLVSIIKKSYKKNLSETLDRILEGVTGFQGNMPLNDDTVIIGFENR